MIVDKYKKKIYIKLHTEIPQVQNGNLLEPPLRLTFKRNGVTSSPRVPVRNDTYNTYSWTIATRNFNVGDELTDFTIYYDGTAELSKLNEGLTFLLDGEDVGKVHDNSYTAKFNEVGTHTIQAIYKGNKNFKTATTDLKTFYVGQEEAGGGGTVPVSEIYWIEFTDLSKSTFKYADGSSVSAKLTKGGVPIAGASVELTVLSASTGYQYTATTQSSGIVNLKLGRLGVGNHTLIATYKQYNESTHFDEVVCSCQRKIKIVKNDPTIKYQNQDASHPYTFYTGDEIWIQFIEPDYTALNDQTFPIYVNGKVYNIMTNVNGRVWLRLWYTGTYRFKAVFTGNSNLNKKTKEFTIVVRSR